jgi:hypothetical protein
MATKKVTKRKSAKVVTKKAKAIAKVKAFKHKRVVMEPVGTESLPDMVFIASAPAWAKDIVGKRYVNADRAIAIIEALDTEKAIAKGAKAVKKELLAAGVTPLDNTNIETE